MPKKTDERKSARKVRPLKLRSDQTCRLRLDNRGAYHVSELTRPPSEVIATVIATIEDADQTEFAPLYDVVNPSALDMLFRQTRAGTPRSDGFVSFEYASYEIIYEANNELTLRPVNDCRRAERRAPGH